MRYVIALFLFFIISTITLNTCLNVINQKNNIIYSQQKQIKTYQSKITLNENIIKNETDSISKLKSELTIAKDANKHLHYLGSFKVTYYDLHYESCNKTKSNPAYGITFSGNRAVAGITIAVDSSVIPLGSYVYIDKIGCRVAQDIGSGVHGMHVDCFVNDFSYDKYKINQAEIYLIE